MKQLFIPYDLALLAKEKGYNERDFAYYRLSLIEEQEPFVETEINYFHKYNDNHNFRSHFNERGYEIICTAPLYQQIIDWFRDVHKIEVSASFVSVAKCWIDSLGYLSDKKIKHTPVKCNSYYDALNKAIEEAFKLI